MFVHGEFALETQKSYREANECLLWYNRRDAEPYTEKDRLYLK